MNSIKQRERLGIHHEFNEIERKAWNTQEFNEIERQAWYTQRIQLNREKGLVYTMNSMKQRERLGIYNEFNEIERKAWHTQ